MAPFYERDSAASRLQNHCKEAHFVKSQKTTTDTKQYQN